MGNWGLGQLLSEQSKDHHLPARAFVLVCAALTVVAPLSCATANATADIDDRTITGREFATLLENGGVDASNVTVTGDVDLRGAGRITEIVSCEDCTIAGSLKASDIEFARVVSLPGLSLVGSLDVHGATFDDAFLLQRSARRPAVVHGPADLRMVTFRHRASFDGAQFNDEVVARNLTARDNTSWVDSAFMGAADLSRTHWSATASFNGAAFGSDAAFGRAIFNGPSSFRGAQFGRRATFDAAAFGDAVDFAFAGFHDATTFEQATFAAAANFRSVRAIGTLSFDQAHLRGTLDMEAAYLTENVSLASMTGAGVVSMSDMLMAPNSWLRLEPMRITGLRLDPASVRHLRGPRERIDALHAVEKTAIADGDMRLANRSKYARLAAEGGKRGTSLRVLDAVFYRGIAGYLVRPIHPLAVLLTVVAVASTVRILLRVRPPSRARRRRVARSRDALLVGVSESVRRATTLRLRTHDADARQPTIGDAALVAEWCAYKVLTALLLVSVANASPTLREVINALS